MRLRARPASKTPESSSAFLLHTDTNDMADDVVAVYLRNVRTVAALADQYGFRFSFFWQPSREASDKKLTDEEDDIEARLIPVTPLLRAVYDRVREAARHEPHLHFIGNMFDDEVGSIFIDFVHVVPTGNKLIATKMADILLDSRTQPLVGE